MPAVPMILAHHKPKGVVVTADDERGRPTVFSRMPDEFRIFAGGNRGEGGLGQRQRQAKDTQSLNGGGHGGGKDGVQSGENGDNKGRSQSGGWLAVGRLDMDSRGLLLFVRDGKLMDALSRPGACDKEYEVWVRGRVTPEHVAAMVRGVESPVGLLRAVSVELAGGAGPKSRVRVVLDEGKNRHIRRMFGALKDGETGAPLKVLELKRIRIGPVKLGLESGQWGLLAEAEVRALLDAVGWRG